MKGGISLPYLYKITNEINGKVYIGKTSLTVEERYKEHLRDYKKDTKEKRPLYDAFNKYGINNFSVVELEKVANDDIASIREKELIEEYRSYIGFDDCNGYNATLGGDGKRLYDYLLLSQEYQKLGSVKAVCAKYNCDKKTVRLACRENNVEIKIAPNQKKIQRIDAKGNVKEYNSIIEAAKDFPDKAAETARKNISRGLNAHKTAYGYKWIQI